MLIARFHGGDDVFLDLFHQAHSGAIIAEWSCAGSYAGFTILPDSERRSRASDNERFVITQHHHAGRRSKDHEQSLHWVQLEAKPGKEKALEEFLKSA